MCGFVVAPLTDVRQLCGISGWDACPETAVLLLRLPDAVGLDLDLTVNMNSNRCCCGVTAALNVRF